jgi:hypothetical protein
MNVTPVAEFYHQIRNIESELQSFCASSESTTGAFSKDIHTITVAPVLTPV